MAVDPLSNWFQQQRRLRVDDTIRALQGEDPRKSAGADALAAQQFTVGMAVRSWYDANFDPVSLIQNLLVGACFIADNHGVSREQLAKLIMMVELKSDRQLIYNPNPR